MCWQAAHGAIGVNFHNKRWIYTDTIYLDKSGDFQINPKAYALKAFNLGSHGNLVLVTISNPSNINLTAYAVRSSENFFLTIINKTHGIGARVANVTIGPDDKPRQADAIFLAASDGSATARADVTLGGVSITSDARWLGHWSTLESNKLQVPATSAAIVRITGN